MKGDTTYLFTDGFADQFGGEDGMSNFFYSRFRELLLDNCHDTMEKSRLRKSDSLNGKATESKLTIF